jgi:hypothetical protein
MQTLSALLLIASVATLIFTLYFFWYKENRQVRNTSNPRTHTLRFQKQTRHLTKDVSDSEKHGAEFEKFIVTLFDKKFFTLMEWRSDKQHNGIYAQSSMNPDMEWRFSTNYQTVHFAVECKWRKKFYDNHIQWAKDYQLSNYRKFEAERRMHVFIVIGIGGISAKPEELYIVPLQNIQTLFLDKFQLKDYKRYRPDKPFFLNVQSMVLE